MDFRGRLVKLLKLHSKFGVVLASYEGSLLWKKMVRTILSGEKATSLKNFLNNQGITAHDYGLAKFIPV